MATAFRVFYLPWAIAQVLIRVGGKRLTRVNIFLVVEVKPYSERGALRLGELGVVITFSIQLLSSKINTSSVRRSDWLVYTRTNVSVKQFQGHNPDYHVKQDGKQNTNFESRDVDLFFQSDNWITNRLVLICSMIVKDREVGERDNTSANCTRQKLSNFPFPPKRVWWSVLLSG